MPNEQMRIHLSPLPAVDVIFRGEETPIIKSRFPLHKSIIQKYLNYLLDEGFYDRADSLVAL